MRFGAPQEKPKAVKGMRFSQNKRFSRNVFLGVHDVLSRKKLYVTMFAVLAIAAFILIVPQNLYNTISDTSFMTYMGVGESDLIIALSQTETNAAQAKSDIEAALAADGSIESYTALSGRVFSMPVADGHIARLRVDLGDHMAFPVKYSEGAAPVNETEIALSSLNAEELGKSIGDELTLVVDGTQKNLTVCGIYSDITAAGKTAKAAFAAKDADLMRVVIPVTLRAGAKTAETAARYQTAFPSATVAVTGEYVRQTFGGTLDAIQKASTASIAVAVLLIGLITLLFIKMLVTKDRYPIAVMKSMGFTVRDIRRQYMTRSIIVAAMGVIIGTGLANTLGEGVSGLLISSMGATTFHFVINPVFAYLLAPLLIAVCVAIATRLGVTSIRRLRISDYIKEA